MPLSFMIAFYLKPIRNTQKKTKKRLKLSQMRSYNVENIDIIFYLLNLVDFLQGSICSHYRESIMDS